MDAIDTVEVLALDDILPLRLAVLRDGTPSRDPRYDGDSEATHLGIRRDGRVIACSSWLPRPFPLGPADAATQLRGMAVAAQLQGLGIGRVLLRAGVARAASLGSRVVWARARDAALSFYEANGFDTVGEPFVDEATGLGHHLVVSRVARG